MSVQVKICGLTDAAQAVQCVEYGADAIGMVFFPPSGRFVEDLLAEEICLAVGEQAVRVGVFAGANAESILRRVKFCGLDVVQLHGNESPQLAGEVKSSGVRVVKVLKTAGRELLKEAESFAGCVDAFLVEAGRGELPGGNGVAWDWAGAKILRGIVPFALAGGLNADRIADAIEASCCDAVDVSSGVEISQGFKDMKKVKGFIMKAKAIDVNCRRVF